MERKEYSIIGKVEIGTDEYRDLIEAVKEAEERYNKYCSDYWQERNRANNLEDQLKALQGQFTLLNEFTNSSEELKAKYQLYKFEKFNKEIKDD